MFNVTLLLISFTIVFCYYFIRTFTFWKARNVPQANIYTTLKDITRGVFALEPFAETWKRVYNRSQKYRYYGTYQLNSPILIIRDEALRKTITIKDFDHFTDHRPLASKGSDTLWEKNVFALPGERWRSMRHTLNPTFTSSKMRQMFTLMNKSVNRFIDFFKNQGNGTILTLEFKDTYTRLSNDVIASCIFGLEVDSLKERQNEFYLMGKESTAFGGFIRSVKFLIALTIPKLAQIIGVPFFTENVRRFFCDLVSRTINLRQQQDKTNQTPDLVTLMMQVRKSSLNQEDESKIPNSPEISFGVPLTTTTSSKPTKTCNLTNEDITAQAVLFLTGGFDTVGSALSFLTYELAANPSIQTKLRHEIQDHFKGKMANSLSYETLAGMKYLDMVVSESLRKWPPVVVTDRVCTKPYLIKSINDNEKDLLINRGESILFPIFAIHRDEEVFPDPEKFDPERFSDEQKEKINGFNYMPFGAGPRHCLGIRFALMEIKIVIVHLLCNFEVIPVEKTVIPMQLQKSQLALNSEHGFWLGLKPWR